MIRLSLVLLLVCILTNSCQNNLTFDNISIEPNPSITMPFLSFDITQNNFYDFTNNTEVISISDTTRYSFFTEGIVRDNLDEMDLFFELNNQFNRDFILKMSFLDQNNQTTYAFNDINVFANSGELEFLRNIIISEDPIFLNSEKFVLTIDLVPDPNNTIDPNVEQQFEFKSRYIAYLSF